MGQPPQHLITRRLIKGFFKSHDVNPRAAVARRTLDEIIKCWQTYGYMSRICKEKTSELAEGIANMSTKDPLLIEGKSLSDYVIAQLNRPIYRHQQKGRYRDAYSGPKEYVNSIYDGVFKKKDVK